MRFSSRSKVSVIVSLAAVVAIVAGFAVYATFGKSASSAHAAGSVSSFTGSLSKAKMTGTVAVSSLPTTGATATGKYLKFSDHGRPSANGVTSAAVAAHRPSVTTSTLTAGSMLHNFDGVNAIQNAQQNGFDVEPPDESIAVGSTYVINDVNLTIAAYKKNGQLVAGPVSIGLFFNDAAAIQGFLNGTGVISDPRAYYDSASHTWFELVWVTDYVGGTSHIDLAVNSGDPVYGSWNIYRIDVTDANAAGCPCLPDFTILGVDQYNVYLLPNEFQLSGAGGFNGSQIYVVSKADLINGNPTPNVVHFGGLSLAGVIAYHLQPANEHGSAPAEYFMNSLDPNNTFDNRLGVWAMTNRAKVSQGVIPNLTATVINSEAYSMPQNAQTPVGFNSGLASLGFPAQTSGFITGDFDALSELTYINGHLYTALNTSVNIPGDTVARDGIAWFDVTPKLSGGTISGSTSVYAQGYIAKQGLYLLYPHVEVSMSGTFAITFSYTGASTYPSAAYIVRQPGNKNFGPVHTAASGAAPDNGFTAVGGAGRWGDYSAGQLDPSGSGIWFATQYIPNNGDQFANWGNRIFEIQG